MKRWWNWLFCKHPRLEFHRNIYGQEIQDLSFRWRSWWWCPDCHRLVPRKEFIEL